MRQRLTPAELREKMLANLTDDDCPGSYWPPKYETEKFERHGDKTLAKAACSICGDYWILQPDETMRKHPRERRHYTRR